MTDEARPHGFIPKGTLPAPASCDVCGKSGFDSTHYENQDPRNNWWCTHCDLQIIEEVDSPTPDERAELDELYNDDSLT